MRDEVRAHEVDLIGNVVRLEIPLKSVMNLRRVAEELRGLAYQLDCLGRFPPDEPADTMLEAKRIVRRANNRLEKIRGRGRPKIGRQFRNPYKI